MAQQVLLPGMPPLPEYGDDNDFYSTPPGAVDAVLPFIPGLGTRPWHILEPAAGEGAILRALLPHTPKAWNCLAMEIHEGRYRELLGWGAQSWIMESGGSFCPMLGDFLKPPEQELVQRFAHRENPWLIPLNPPYSKPYEGIGLDFVETCLALAEQVPGSVVAGLLPLDFATGVDRCKRVHDRWKGSLYPLRRRQDFGGPHGSGQRPVAWFVWDLSNPKNEYQVIG